jgi:hypothetical protein
MEQRTMNDYQMRFFADDHQRQLRAEAEQARLARQARTPRRPPQPTGGGATAQGRQGWLRLGSVLARFVV